MKAPLRQQGIRLATYLDDRLLLAQSEQEAVTQTNVLVKHLLNLGFVINTEKSMLCPAQTALFLGLRLNSVPFSARLSAERVKAFRACLALFQLRKHVLFRSCLRLLGLMASAILVVRLGRLHMREFQRWVAALKLKPQESDGYCEMRNGTAPLAAPDFSSTRCAYGCCPFTESGHHGRMFDRLGRYL
ncbi:hypothetical protein CgunFtcFv8_022118 [Champsocephalus gunnari]|uniref:ribonuclease H n=1 Tax=Champsocephalus gunnari TaxID=52237 RepID=A0AAN8HSC6_CHAGU|nr:hypothetical protein CgunFtcFv8_022118 [Champsocephalus gunnari]